MKVDAAATKHPSRLDPSELNTLYQVETTGRLSMQESQKKNCILSPSHPAALIRSNANIIFREKGR